MALDYWSTDYLPASYWSTGYWQYTSAPIPPAPPTDTRKPKVPWYPSPYATYGFGGAAAQRKQGIIRQRNDT